MIQPIKFTLQAELQGTEHLAALFGTGDPVLGAVIQLANGQMEMQLVGSDAGLGFSDSHVVEIVVTFAGGLSSGIVGNAIYDAIKHGVRHLMVNGRRVRTNAADLAKAIDTTKLVVDKHESD